MSAAHPITMSTTRCSPLGTGCSLTLSKVRGNSQLPESWHPAPPALYSHVDAAPLVEASYARDGQYIGRLEFMLMASIWLRLKKRFW